jgi:hypothetical protein
MAHRSRISGQYKTGGGAYEKRSKAERDEKRRAVAELMAKNAAKFAESNRKLAEAMLASGVGRAGEGER